MRKWAKRIGKAVRNIRTEKSVTAEITTLYTMIVIAALILVLFAGKVYAAVAAARDEGNSMRASAAYIQSRVQASDTKRALKISGEQADCMLILYEGDSGYETRIHISDGWLVEELSKSGENADLGSVLQICEAASFSVEMVRDGLMRIVVNEKEIFINIKSAGGVLHE